MVRAISAVIVGYLVMFILVFGSFTLAYLAMGSERAFKPDSFDVSTLWLGTSMALGFFAAVIGGLCCAVVARKFKTVLALAAVVVVLGLGMAAPAYLTRGEDPGPREGDIANFEAMQQARQPMIALLTNPLIGAIGVLLGGRLVGGSKKEPAPKSEA
ncbi:MAG: hypothetical protein ACYTGC_05300 [Planctomycetota bacterium]|jgi:hypothetical protein